MVAFIRFKCNLFLRFHFFCLHFLYFPSKYRFGFSCGINALGFDRYDLLPSRFYKTVGIDGNNTSLIRLSYVSKDGINHGDKEPVLMGMSSIFNNGYDVGTFLGHIDQITSGSVREFNGVHHSFLKILKTKIKKMFVKMRRFVPVLLLSTFGLTRKIAQIKDFTYGSNDVRDMRYTGSRSCTQIQHFGSWSHVNLINTT